MSYYMHDKENCKRMWLSWLSDKEGGTLQINVESEIIVRREWRGQPVILPVTDVLSAMPPNVLWVVLNTLWAMNIHVQNLLCLLGACATGAGWVRVTKPQPIPIPIPIPTCGVDPHGFTNPWHSLIASDSGDIKSIKTHFLEPRLPLVFSTDENVSFNCVTLFLIPGSWFLLTDTIWHGVALWDLGIHAGIPIIPSPLAVLPTARGSFVSVTSPTPDSRGVYVCIEQV